MAHSAKLIVEQPGTNAINTSYELVFNASTQADIKLFYGTQVQGGLPEVVLHAAEDAEPELVAASEPYKTVFLDVALPPAADQDTLLNILPPIKRAVDGSTSQAVRSQFSPNVGKVWLRLQRDGSTNYTDWPVRYGWVDDGGAYYTSGASINTAGLGVIIMLVVGPYGEGAEQTLTNKLSNAGFTWGDTAGMPWNWNSVGSPTIANVTATWLAGGKCAKMTTDTSTGQSFYNGWAIIGSGAQVAAFIWVQLSDTGGDPLTIALEDGAVSTLQSKTFDPDNPVGWDRKVRKGGNWWYRYSLTGQLTANNARLLMTRPAGVATQVSVYRFDCAYIGEQTTVPDGWSSQRHGENRYDPISADLSQVNVIDTALIPGDAPALARWLITLDTSTDAHGMLAATWSDGVIAAGDWPFAIDADDFTVGAGVDWGDVTDATRTESHYLRLNLPSSLDRTSAQITNAYQVFRQPFRLFSILYHSTAVPSTRFGVSDGTNILQWLDFKSPQANAQWSFVDHGLINVSGKIPDQASGTALGYVHVDEDAGASGQVRVDNVYLIPSEDVLVSEVNSANWTTRYIDGYERTTGATISGGQPVNRPYVGRMWTLQPGLTSNRTLFVFLGDGTSGNTDEHTLSRTYGATLTVKPRTRHLLGTT